MYTIIASFQMFNFMLLFCQVPGNPRKYQIHLKSQNGPINVLLVNKDAAASSPVVTPVPPPNAEINSDTSKVVPMETSAINCSANAFANKENSIVAPATNGNSVQVKTEVLDSSTSRGELQ